MSTLTDVLEFALRYETDPQRASRLADRLGPLALEVSTPAFFPPHWVKNQVKLDARSASYAIKHCNDPDTLHFVAMRDKRMAVRLAVAHNPFISDKTIEFLYAATKDGLCSGAYEIRSALRSSHPAPGVDQRALFLKDPVSVLTNSSDLSGPLAILLDSATSLKETRRVVELVVKATSPWALVFLTDLLKASCGRAESKPWRDLWEKIGFTATEITDLASKSDESVAADALYAVVKAAFVKEGPVLPEELIALVATHYKSMRTWPVPLRPRISSPVFSPASIAQLKSLPGWPLALICQELSCDTLVDLICAQATDTRAKFLATVLEFPIHERTLKAGLNLASTSKLCGTLDDQEKELLLLSVGSSREVAFALVSSISEDYVFDFYTLPATMSNQRRRYQHTTVLDVVLAGLNSVDDPLVPLLVSHASSVDLIEYLAGKWVISGPKNLLPSQQDVTRLLALFESADRPSYDEETKERYQQDLIERLTASGLPSDVLHLFVNTLSDPAHRFMANPSTASYIHSQLSSLELDPDRVIDHLAAHPEMPLGKSLELLRAMKRLAR